ncbi:hypothetical protein ACRAWD_05680 [Caulobacter segnis]
MTGAIGLGAGAKPRPSAGRGQRVALLVEAGRRGLRPSVAVQRALDRLATRHPPRCTMCCGAAGRDRRKARRLRAKGPGRLGAAPGLLDAESTLFGQCVFGQNHLAARPLEQAGARGRRRHAASPAEKRRRPWRSPGCRPRRWPSLLEAHGASAPVALDEAPTPAGLLRGGGTRPNKALAAVAQLDTARRATSASHHYIEYAGARLLALPTDRADVLMRPTSPGDHALPRRSRGLLRGGSSGLRQRRAERMPTLSAESP